MSKSKKSGPKFEFGDFKKVSKIKYGDNNELYIAPVRVNGIATYDDVYKYVDKLKKKYAKNDDTKNSYMSISVKYASMSHPIKTKFFHVADVETDLSAPYDYDEDDHIEGFYVNLAY